MKQKKEAERLQRRQERIREAAAYDTDSTGINLSIYLGMHCSGTDLYIYLGRKMLMLLTLQVQIYLSK